MNNRTGMGAMLVFCLTCFAATGFAQTGGGKVEIKDDYIVVHPGANISKADTQALDAVLGKYDKSLYKIDIYKNGRTKNTLGNLRDMCIDQRAVAELMQAKAQGESNRAIQLVAPGSAVNPTNSQSGSPTPGTAVNPNQGSTPPGAAVPVHPNVLPQMSPVNPTQNTPIPSGPQAPTPTGPQAPIPTGPQAPTPTGPQEPTPTGPQAAVNPQVAVNPTNSHQPCASTDPKASEFLQRVKPILEKYSR